MDMNQLFYHHQMALMTAGRPVREDARCAGIDLPRHYARRIEQYRARRGMPVYFRPADATG